MLFTVVSFSAKYEDGDGDGDGDGDISLLQVMSHFNVIAAKRIRHF